jgi:aryl-phospho-beta-D-glucosidase BglC (GH1 family)
MADYGLNTVRIPVPYWIWNVTESEPFITGSQIPHLQRALNWSYVYGLDVILDMHALPGECDESVVSSLERMSALINYARQARNRVIKFIPVSMLKKDFPTRPKTWTEL